MCRVIEGTAMPARLGGLCPAFAVAGAQSFPTEDIRTRDLLFLALLPQALAEIEERRESFCRCSFVRFN
jgi:hypothetical protein